MPFAVPNLNKQVSQWQSGGQEHKKLCLRNFTSAQLQSIAQAGGFYFAHNVRYIWEEQVRKCSEKHVYETMLAQHAVAGPRNNQATVKVQVSVDNVLRKAKHLLSVWLLHLPLLSVEVEDAQPCCKDPS